MQILSTAHKVDWVLLGITNKRGNPSLLRGFMQYLLTLDTCEMAMHKKMSHGIPRIPKQSPCAGGRCEGSAAARPRAARAVPGRSGSPSARVPPLPSNPCPAGCPASLTTKYFHTDLFLATYSSNACSARAKLPGRLVRPIGRSTGEMRVLQELWPAQINMSCKTGAGELERKAISQIDKNRDW